MCGQATPGRYRTSFQAEAFKSLSLKMLGESGAHLLLYTMVVDSIVKDGAIRGVIIESKSGRQAILAVNVVDATGDADVAFRAGTSTVKGREKDGRMRPISLFFRMCHLQVEELLCYMRANPQQFSPDPSKNIMDMDSDPPMLRPLGFFDLVREAKKKGDYPEECHYLRLDNLNLAQGIVTVNATRVYDVDGTRAEDLTKAYFKGEEQAEKIISFLQKYVPGFSRACLLDKAPVLGVRETRRIVGDYVLTEDDIVQGRVFSDVICVSGYRHTRGNPVHSPDGQEGAESDAKNRRAVDRLFVYGIPYQSILPKGIEGLLVAGRCISVTHEADAYTRVLPSCMLTGQAAGTAAAISAINGVTPRNVDVGLLQNRLDEQGVRLVIPVASSVPMPS